MASALDISKKAVRLWRSVHGDENLYGQCQRFSGFYEQWAWSGKDTGIHTYWNATAAADASRMYETRNINSAAVKPGDQVFWWWNPDGHVATVLGRQNGRTVVSHTGTKSHDVIARLGNGVVVSHADTITLPFRGLSRTNGANKQRTGMTAWPGAKTSTNPQEKKDLDIMAADCFIRRSTQDTVYAIQFIGSKQGKPLYRGLSKLEWTVYQRARKKAGLGVPVTEEGPAAMKSLIGRER